MPDISTLFLFAAAALSLNVTPGPDMLYVMARSLGQGPRAGIVSALGLSVGYGVHTLLAASGLAALLISAPAAFYAVKVAGALYLAFLGIQALRRSFQPDPMPEPLPSGGEPAPAFLVPGPDLGGRVFGVGHRGLHHSKLQGKAEASTDSRHGASGRHA